MTGTYYIRGSAGRPGFLSTIARTAFLAAAAIGGIFILIFATAFALFAIAGIAVIGFLVFAFFWAKAKITGKPFGPRAKFQAQMNAMRRDMESQMGQSVDVDGPVVDAHRTPDGWTVDD